MRSGILPWVVAAAIVGWPATLGAALVDRLHAPVSLAGTLVYAVAGRVCHQQPARSFATRGASWPVCARCSGLYLAAPFGAVAALGARRRWSRRAMAMGVIGAALVMGMMWAIEAAGLAAIEGVWRAVTAAPLGATIGAALVVVATPAGARDRVD